MSTTGIDSWAVDLKDIGAIYPFQGSEVLFVIIGVVTWIGWHVWSAWSEDKKYQVNIAKYGGEESLKTALEKD